LAIGSNCKFIGINASACSLHRNQIHEGPVHINEPPYGTERVYNALRLAHALVKKEPTAQITVFLMADAVVAGRAQQKTPEGYYNVERMLKRVISGKGSILLCGTCMDARGMSEAELLEGAQRSTMDALANATAEADRVLVF
jgi:uncharacterized protein involved in oxidation of intracellular sulfur